MRLLIIRGGIAGLTLAARLRQQGRDPMVIERASPYGESGYAIGLYPLGSCVLHGLGVYDGFLRRGVVSKRYEAFDHAGRLLQGMDMSVLTAQAGPLVMLARADLIDLLRMACGDLPIRMGIPGVAVRQQLGRRALSVRRRVPRRQTAAPQKVISRLGPRCSNDQPRRQVMDQVDRPGGAIPAPRGGAALGDACEPAAMIGS